MEDRVRKRTHQIAARKNQGGQVGEVVDTFPNGSGDELVER